MCARVELGGIHKTEVGKDVAGAFLEMNRALIS
jgi:hypothetical protein